jgi:hypothetical protein
MTVLPDRWTTVRRLETDVRVLPEPVPLVTAAFT